MAMKKVSDPNNDSGRREAGLTFFMGGEHPRVPYNCKQAWHAGAAFEAEYWQSLESRTVSGALDAQEKAEKRVWAAEQEVNRLKKELEATGKVLAEETVDNHLLEAAGLAADNIRLEEELAEARGGLSGLRDELQAELADDCLACTDDEPCQACMQTARIVGRINARIGKPCTPS